MNEIERALRSAIKAMELANISCQNFNHEKKHQHLLGKKCMPEDIWKDALNYCKSALAEFESREIVAWQFLQDGEWHNGSNKNNHKQNTIDGGYLVRDLVAVK